MLSDLNRYCDLCKTMAAPYGNDRSAPWICYLCTPGPMVEEPTWMEREAKKRFEAKRAARIEETRKTKTEVEETKKEAIESERVAKPSNRLLFASKKSDDKSVKGVIARINPGSQGVEGWKSGLIRTKDDTVKFAGSCFVKAGDAVKLHGSWGDDPKYGRQFRVQYATAAIGDDVEAIQKLVETGDSFRQIGPRRAGYIADYMKETGLDLEEILDDTETLADLKRYAKLPDEAVECLVKSWSERREENLTKAELLSLGVPAKNLEIIWKSYGRYSADAVRDNPYTLTETLASFGIGEADKIAIGGLKFDRADHRRLVCGITHTMRRNVIHKGHTWITMGKLSSLTVTELQIGRSGDHKKTAATLNDLIATGRLLTTQINGIDDLVVCDTKLFADENKFVKAFSPEKKAEPNPHFVARPLDPDWIKRVGSFVPNAKQIEGVESFAKHKLLALTGAAGCGKSVFITMILKICIERSLHVALGAPTGKAAKRISELLDKSGIAGAPMPMTIHKMLGYQGDRWTYNEKEKLSADVVIIDESSMVDLSLMARLLEAMRSDACLVLVGDHKQLPPVGPGAVLRDVVEGELCRVVKLEDVLRQAGALRKNATDILRGIMVPTTTDEKLGIVTWEVMDQHRDAQGAHEAIVNRYRELLTEIGERGFLEIQVLAPKYDGVVGIDSLNRSLRVVAQQVLYGEECNPDKAIGVGDKVIQTKNDYTVGLMNGDQGVVVETSGFQNETGRHEPGWKILVQRGDSQEEFRVPLSRTEGFMLAYAITVHRFQGSEAEHVIGAVHSEHGDFMLNRKLIYTMATRASKTLLLVGDRKGMHEGVRRDDTSYRRTLTAPPWLVEKLAKDPTA